MNSSRLPGKVLKPIGGKLLLEHIFFRLGHLSHQTTVVVATTDTLKDDVVEEFCVKHGVECYRGSEENVLERYFLCARKYGFKHIIRLTGDNPFVDIEELDNLIALHFKSGSDFTYSHDVLPVGVGAEVMTFKALEVSYEKGREPHHIEHVDEYIIDNMDRFKTSRLEVPEEKQHPDIRLTVDTDEDYRKACFIVEHARDEYITTEEAIELCLQFA